MVTRIMAIQRLDLASRDHRNAADGDRKKPQHKASFKEVFAKQLSSTAKPPVTRV